MTINPHFEDVRSADVRCEDVRAADVRCEDVRAADVRCEDVRSADVSCVDDCRCNEGVLSQLLFRRTRKPGNREKETRKPGKPGNQKSGNQQENQESKTP